MIELENGIFVNPVNIATITTTYQHTYHGDEETCTAIFVNQQKLEISATDRDKILKHMNGDAKHE